jgi:hypothetical protein
MMKDESVLWVLCFVLSLLFTRLVVIQSTEHKAQNTNFILPPSSFILLLLVARGGIEPRAFPPNSLRFGLEDRCRERGRLSDML